MILSSPASLARVLVLSLAPWWMLSAMPSQARADDKERISILEENDSLYFNSDKHYTQGVRISYLAPDLDPKSAWNDPFDLVSRVTPIFLKEGSARSSRRYALFLGQSLFTPKNLTLKPPDPHDRPYGGWAYVGVSLLQECGQLLLENLELDLGVVGPVALGKQVQNNFHQLIGKEEAQGWSNQIQNEPGAVLTYERLWRLPLIRDGADGIDIIPQSGATIGNIFTYGDVGGLLRIGKNLLADYGPVRIRPALSGTDYFNGDQLDGKFGFYFFAGAQGRVVGRNVFLDGNSFRQSPNVPKKTLIADLQAGFSVFWGTALRVDFSVVRRTAEFVGQRTPDEVGTAALAFSW
jgi:lipid A 3-O-deacylase